MDTYIAFTEHNAVEHFMKCVTPSAETTPANECGPESFPAPLRRLQHSIFLHPSIRFTRQTCLSCSLWHLYSRWSPFLPAQLVVFGESGVDSTSEENVDRHEKILATELHENASGLFALQGDLNPESDSGFANGISLDVGNFDGPTPDGCARPHFAPLRAFVARTETLKQLDWEGFDMENYGNSVNFAWRNRINGLQLAVCADSSVDVVGANSEIEPLRPGTALQVQSGAQDGPGATAPTFVTQSFWQDPTMRPIAERLENSARRANQRVLFLISGLPKRNSLVARRYLRTPQSFVSRARAMLGSGADGNDFVESELLFTVKGSVEKHHGASSSRVSLAVFINAVRLTDVVTRPQCVDHSTAPPQSPSGHFIFFLPSSWSARRTRT